MASGEPKNYDVAVVGAGPGGCSAARLLAQSGFKVLLIEKAKLPRYKTCGGGVLGRAYKLLSEGARAAVEREFRSVALNFLDLGLGYVATRSKPLVYMTMRAELDGLLAREAQAAGAELVESCPVRGISLSHDCVEIGAQARTFRARFVVAADGVHSATAKALAWSELPQLAPALEWEIWPREADFERFGSTARFDFGCVEAGYAWVFPKRDHLSVGILSTRQRSPDLQRKLEDYLRSVGIVDIQRCDRHGYLIPVAPRPGRLARGRVLLVGDAAGLTDPITAEGISHAIISGQLAARALVEEKLDIGRVAGRYQALLNGTILEELKAARFLANFLYNCPWFRNWALRRRGERLTDFVADVVMGEASYSRALRSPSSYLKMLGLDSGAFALQHAFGRTTPQE